MAKKQAANTHLLTLAHTHTQAQSHCIVCCVGSEVSQIECAALTELWQLVWPTDTGPRGVAFEPDSGYRRQGGLCGCCWA